MYETVSPELLTNLLKSHIYEIVKTAKKKKKKGTD